MAGEREGDRGAGASPRAATRGRALSLELLATILLAFAAVTTAWSSYQSARWSGAQAIAFSRANASRLESTRASTQAGQRVQVNIAIFGDWANAYADGDKRLARFYLKRMRPRFRAVVQKWVASKPLTNPDAAPTPFDLPSYHVPEAARAAALTDRAERSAELAKRNNQRSDNYVLALVLFASSLFFAGISTKLPRRRLQVALLGVGWLFFIGTFAWILTFPVSISV